MQALKHTSILLSITAGYFSSVLAQNNRPNLLVIHTDEHNFRTLSCYQDQLPEEQAFVWGTGNNIKTPNIDRIANEGAICMRYGATTPVSTPSRGSLVSGLYPQKNGAWVNGVALRKDVPTFASILADNGYSTSYIGKWHLDREEDDDKYKFDVQYNGGFTDNRYMMNRGHSPYFEIIKDVPGEQVEVNCYGKDKRPEALAGKLIHMTDFFTNKAIDVINRDRDKPFCLMISIPDPHTPDYATGDYHTKYDDMDVQMPKTMEPKMKSKRPKWGANEKNDMATFKPEPLRQYMGMVKHIDDNVGRILQCLEDNGILDNTIVVFTSDHGDLFYEHSRMNKGNPYEASLNIPFLIRYPEKVRAGKVLTKAYVNCDFTPTILSMMEVKHNATFDGTDTSADFATKRKPKDQHRIVNMGSSFGEWYAACDDRYKLVISKSDTPWLFDKEKDPFETINMYNKKGYEEISARLMKQLEIDMERYQQVDPNNQKLPARRKAD